VEREGDRIIISPSISAEKFEQGLKGRVRGSKIPPEKLKEIWGIEYALG